MEFKPAEIHLTLRSYGDKTSRASKLRVQLARGRYWPAIKTEEAREQRQLILNAVHQAFQPGDTETGFSEIAVYRIVTDLCVQGYALSLVEDITRRLEASTMDWATRLAETVAQETERSRKIAVAAEAWRTFFQAVSFLARALRYLDQVYVQRSALKGWITASLNMCKFAVESKDKTLMTALAREIVANVVAASTALMEHVAETETYPADTKSFPSDQTADIETLCHMFLDLEHYETTFEPKLLSELRKRFATVARTIVAPLSPKTAIQRTTPQILLLRELASVIHVENVRIAEELNSSTMPPLVKAAVEAFYVDQSRYFTDSSLPQLKRAYPGSFVPLEILPSSGAFSLFLDNEFGLLRLAIQSAALFDCLKPLVEAWTAGCHNATLNFLDAIYGDEKAMSSEEHKSGSFALLAGFTDNVNTATQMFDINFTFTSTYEYHPILNSALQVLTKLRMMEAHKAQDSSTFLQKVFRQTREAISAALQKRHTFAQSVALCLVAYVDRVMRDAHVDESEKKRRLNSVTFLLVANDWKHLVRSAHEDAMALRVFGQAEPCEEVERFFVAMVAQECGDSYVTTMDTILREYDSSNQLEKETKSKYEGLGFEMLVRVCPANIWPAAKRAAAKEKGGAGQQRQADAPQVQFPDVLLPPSVRQGLEAYGEMYRKRFENRLLRFDLDFSSALIIVNVSMLSGGSKRVKRRHPRYEFELSARQAILLLHFNDEKEWSLTGLSRITRMDVDRIKSLLKPLHSDAASAALIWEAEPQMYSINKAFNGAERQVTVANPRENEDTTDVNQARAIERSSRMAAMALEAGIVRHMKGAHKQKFSDILVHVTQSKLGLPVTSAVLKETLDRLVEKGEPCSLDGTKRFHRLSGLGEIGQRGGGLHVYQMRTSQSNHN